MLSARKTTVNHYTHGVTGNAKTEFGGYLPMRGILCRGPHQPGPMGYVVFRNVVTRQSNRIYACRHRDLWEAGGRMQTAVPFAASITTAHRRIAVRDSDLSANET